MFLAEETEELINCQSFNGDEIVDCGSSDLSMTGKEQDNQKSSIKISEALSGTRDVVHAAKNASILTFYLAKLGTLGGFKIASTVLQAPKNILILTGRDESALTHNPVLKVLATLDAIVTSAQTITEGGMCVSEYLTVNSLSLADKAFGWSGVENGHLYRMIGKKALGDDDSVESAVALIDILCSLTKDKSLFQLTDWTSLKLIASLQHRFLKHPNPFTCHSVHDDDAFIHKIMRYQSFVAGTKGLQSLRRRNMIPVDEGIDSDDACVTHLTGIAPNDILYRSYRSQEGCVYKSGLYVALDHSMKSIHIVFGGTSNHHDLLADLNCASTPWRVNALSERTELAHEGFQRTLTRIIPVLLPVVHGAVAEHIGYSVTCIGYSLGAALASMLAIHWEHIFPGVRAFVFAAPPTFPLAFASHPHQAGIVTAVLVGHDMVPRLSHAAVDDLLDLKVHLSKNPDLMRRVDDSLTQARKLDDIIQEVTTVGDCGDPDAMERALQGHTDLEEVMGLLQCVDGELEGLYHHLMDTHCSRPKLYPVGRLLYIPTEEFLCFDRNAQATDSHSSEGNTITTTTTTITSTIASISNDPAQGEGAPSSRPSGGGGGGGEDEAAVDRGRGVGEEEHWAEGKPANGAGTSGASSESGASGGLDAFDARPRGRGRGQPRRVMVEAQQQHFSCLALHLDMYTAHLWHGYSEGVEALLHSSS